jgi:peptidoglycan/xylan/chitin deacetylase (PgdA/CDA1 family)
MPRTERAGGPPRTMRRFTPLLASWLAIGALWLPLTVAAKPIVVFTFDVESEGDLHMDQQLDPECEGGTHCGVMEMARMLNAHHVAGTFFVNPYEYKWIGAEAVRGVAVALDTAGQDVELHTHPESAFDPNRHYMYEYNLDEQVEIVRSGAALLKEWTGKTMVAHRAGAYGADANTLLALARNGIVWDTSAFWKHPQSRLDLLNQPRNLPWVSGGVNELPVNVYERVDRARLAGLNIESTPVIRKVDVDWIVNPQEARDALDSFVAADVPVIVVFAHSFSFINGKNAGGRFIADRGSMDLLAVILDEVAKHGLEVRTMRDIAVNGLPAHAAIGDPLPRIAVRAGLGRALLSVAKQHRALVVAAAAGGLLMLAAGAAWQSRRRRVPAPRTADGA